MNRKFYDSLRGKYKLPTISIDSIEIAVEDEFDTADTDEMEELRKHIAFLTRIYREVIVRHYLNGESVETIANALQIPVGTVKSRLSSGRTHIKKGFDSMEKYTKQSYEPQVLHVGISGIQGLNGEPYNITERNLIAQNLLILAYEQPLTETELAKAIGIPAAYIESVIESLVRNELMKRVGNKVYTDFIIYSHNDVAKNIEPQRKLINDNFAVFWKPLQAGLNKLRSASFYVKMAERKRHKLEYYFLMHTMSQCFFGAGAKIYDGSHEYPQRPNGGQWVAMGYSYPQNYDYNNSEIHKYTWSGERTNEVHDTLGAKKLILKVFDTPLEKQRYFHTKSILEDDVLAKMLYIINKGITPSDTGIDMLYFENIPYLAECGVLHIEGGKPAVDIPILTKEEHSELAKITGSVKDEFIPSALTFLTEHLKNARAKLPPDLKSVPEQKQYLEAMGCLHIFVVFRAKEEKAIMENIAYPCPPMVLIVEE
ncbi:MAG: RNA polymerase sigma factor [Tannerella sp.]|jgi:RNA polymerase sigma-70 factor (ECF subfamily)|nr:RNA polymerase sigma factor [Tannerella sp.]